MSVALRPHTPLWKVKSQLLVVNKLLSCICAVVLPVPSPLLFCPLVCVSQKLLLTPPMLTPIKPPTPTPGLVTGPVE
ncbi:hypothetical protein D3C81_805290 [compost metagenome]